MTELFDAPVRDGAIKLHGPEGFEGMRRAGRLAADCLDMLTPHVLPGVTTAFLDDLARQFIIDNGALPACLGYRGYRHTICTSINHVVCHGIPGQRALREGDIVNVDVTVIVDGWHGDTSRMYGVGKVSPRAKRLVEITYEGLARGLAAVKPGANTLEVDVVNTWNNRLAGDAGLPVEQRHTSITAPTVGKDSPLLPAGLLGPVRLWHTTD